MCFLRNLALSAETVTQYTSHVITTLKQKGLHLHTEDLRSPRSSLLVHGWRRQDSLNLPQRLKVKIPLTASILPHLFTLIIQLFGTTPLAKLLSAAFALGYAAAFRPCEYLTDAKGEAGTHTLTGHHCFFQWAGKSTFYPVTLPANYPPGLPVFFVALLDSSKHDILGHGGPRAIAIAPPGSPFCCLTTIFHYLRQYPPTALAPLLSGAGLPLAPAVMGRVLKLTAVQVGLDPARLVPHSLRVGSVCQLEGFSDETVMRHTGHRSRQGLYAYCRASLLHAQQVSPALHDVGRLALPYLRLTYMTPANEDD